MHCHLNSKDLVFKPAFQWELFKHTDKKKCTASSPRLHVQNDIKEVKRNK